MARKLYCIFRLFLSENPERSGLPAENGIERASSALTEQGLDGKPTKILAYVAGGTAMRPFQDLARPLAALVLLAVTLLPAAASAADFPVTVEHAFGTTTLPARPERVATVAWANHEVPLALGIVPVGFARANFGDDDGDGVLPGVAARLEDLGAEVPPLFDEGDGIDFEAVAASRPDVILAAYSGLSRAE